MNPQTITRKLVAILSADVQGYSRLMGEDEEATLRTLTAYREVMTTCIQRHNGRVVNSPGDNLLAEFDSVVEALSCAVAIQKELKEQNASLPVHRQMLFRIGLNLGDVLVEDEQIYGDGVNIAARLEGLAEGGGICISSSVYDQVEDKLPLTYQDLGEQIVKNIAKPIRAYRVKMEADAFPTSGESVLPDQPSLPTLVSSVAISSVRLVGRDVELTHLRECLEKAKHGERQVLFLTGEPGIGKTTVVDAFLAQLGLSQDLWITQGQCVEQYGEGEAYLPVLEALGRLGRAPGHQEIIAVFAQYAPTWLAQLPALVNLSDREGLQRTLLGATQERMLREFTDALEVLTTRRPVVLVLEDLHWSDHSTVEMIAYLAQRRGPARLLLIGTYRPADLVASSHPLKGVVQELQARGRGEELRLAVLREPEVGAYVRERFVAGTQDSLALQNLAASIHQRTEGNPLFMVSMVEHLLHEGLIEKKDGQWRISRDIAVTEVGVPDSLRQLIEKQFEGLSTEEQRILTVGSVVGIEFTAAIVAAALEQELEEVEKRCASLAAKGQFVRAAGIEEWPDGTLSGRYSFSHALYQNTVYERVSAARRIGLHRCIGERKEKAYGQRAGEIASELAVHFEKGHDHRQAVHYLEQAGKNATRRHAHREAIKHLTKGLELLQTLPHTPERTQHELTLQLTLVGPLLTGKGYTAPEVEKVYSRARELCHQLGDPPQPFAAVLFGLCIFYQLRGELQKGRELAEQLLALARTVQNPTLLLRAHMALGNALYFLGDFAACREHLAQGFTFYSAQKHSPLVSNIAQDLGVICLSRAALALWFLGYPDQARLSSDKGFTLAQELAHPFSQAFALHAAAGVHHECRTMQVVSKQNDRLLALSEENGFPYYAAWGTILQGGLWTLLQEKGEAGLERMLYGLTALRVAGSELGLSFFVALLAEAYAKVGQTEEGLAVLAETLDMVHKTGERFYEAELYRLKGTLTLQSKTSLGRVSLKSQASQDLAKDTGPRPLTPDPQVEAEACFQQALDIARKQGAKSLELRAVMSLARLWQSQGKISEARQLLEETYGWFGEGFDTKDLQDAATLLTALGGRIEKLHCRHLSENLPAKQNTLLPLSPSPSQHAETDTSSGPRPGPEQLFRNDGEYWTLAFQGTLCRIKDTRGVQYLARLLQNPDKELHALTLERGSTNLQGNNSTHLSPAEFTDENSTERARINVTRALKAAITKIAASHPALGQYLRHTIKTGTFCSYIPSPDQPFSWQF